MHISKRTGISLLLLSIMVAFTVQYPLFKVHSGNWDSYFILFMARGISDMGYAPWIANWSSYFGMHKTSYPQAAPFILSSIYSLSSTTWEETIFIYSYAIALIAALSLFVLGLKIRRKDYLFSFFLTFLFSVSPTFLYISQWTASARGLLIGMVPFLLLLNIMFIKREERRKVLFIGIFSLFTLFSIHRMAVFALISSVSSLIIVYVMEKYIDLDHFSRRIRFKKDFIIKIYIYLMAGIFALSALIFYTQPKVVVQISERYAEGRLVMGDSALASLMNMAIGFTASAGLLVVMIIPSVLYLVRESWKSRVNTYIFLLFVFSMFFIFFPMYFRAFAALSLAILIALYISKIYYIDNKKKYFKIKKYIPVLLISTVIYSSLLLMMWNGYAFGEGDYSGSKQWMDYEQESMAETVENMPGERFYFTSGDINRFMSASTEKFILPAGFKYYYIYINFGYLKPERLNITLSPEISWGGEMYIYRENANFTALSAKFHSLSSYQYIEIINGEDYHAHLSNKTMDISENYYVYSSERYTLVFLDPMNDGVRTTKLFF